MTSCSSGSQKILQCLSTFWWSRMKYLITLNSVQQQQRITSSLRIAGWSGTSDWWGKNPCKWSRNTLEELSHREAQSYFSDGSTLYYGLLASKQRNSWKGQQGNSEDTEKSFFGITDAIESMVQIAFIDSECLEKLEVEITCTWSTNYCVPWIACAQPNQLDLWLSQR